MAKITIKELYYGDKYAVMSEVFKTMFLASEQARMITGQVIKVSGGKAL